MSNSLLEFTNLYSVTRTLAFQLKPVGKTAEYIQQRGLISEDEDRAEKYKKVKKIIDVRHKRFIDDVLGSFSFEQEELDNYQKLYFCRSKRNKKEKENKEDEKKNDEFRKCRNALWKKIAEAFHNHADYKKLKEEKDLIKKYLDEICTTEDEKSLVHEFDKWTSYFTGFCINRENMYGYKSTAIGFRIVEQNFPKFLDNTRVFQKCTEADKEIFQKLAPEILALNKISSLEEIFTWQAYSKVLTQTAIDAYNGLIGGYSPENGQKIQGLNEYINLYNQKNKTKLPQFVPLFKQILSDRKQGLSFLPEMIKNDQELLDTVREVWNVVYELLCDNQDSIPTLLSEIREYDPKGIFIEQKALKKIMQQIYGSWDTFKIAWIDQYKIQNPPKKKTKIEKYLETMEKKYDHIKSFSVTEIQDILTEIHKDRIVQTIPDYFSEFALSDENGKKIFLLSQVNEAYKAVQVLLDTDYPEDKKLVNDKAAIAKIKNLFDSIKDIQHYLKMLSGTGKEPDKDMAFYSKLNTILDTLEPFTLLYNRVHNYLCQKPYSKEKFKLNFDCVTLLKGWDENQEQTDRGTLFRYHGLFYLGIIKTGEKVDFHNIKQEGTNYFEKMVYKNTGKPLNLLFNLMEINGKTVKVNGHKISDSNNPEQRNPDLEHAKNQYLPPEINRIRKTKSYLPGESFSKEDLVKFIEFYQERVIAYKAPMTFKFKDADLYESFKDFENDVNANGFSIRFEKIPVAFIDSLVDEGKLYLFQIWNKDFSEFSKGTPNIHTLYWKALFDAAYLEDIIFKLSGAAEVFYRKASIPTAERIVHPANQPVKLYRNPQASKIFKYDLIKNRRYTYDQFSLHAKIDINFKADGKTDINKKVRSFIKQEKDLHIIGIDRGERNLIYVSVIDSQGRIKEQKSLNEIVSRCKNQDFKTDYHALLDEREKDSDKAQKSWQTIEKIKDLKAGYLSQVIHELTNLIVKYNAIVCLEDLNFGFIRRRQKVDKSVYQQFEQKLIEKLQYVADKKVPARNPLGILHGLQLVLNPNDKNDSKDIHNGIIFYIPAWCTSKIDPVTGFINLFESRQLRWENITTTKEFFEKFRYIHYNREQDFFEFKFDYLDFQLKTYDSQTLWTVCSYGERIESFRNSEKKNQWDSRTTNLTSAFKGLFAKYSIDLEKDIKEQIQLIDTKDFWETMLHLFKLTLQLRNSRSNSTKPEDDYILSPVKDKDGAFFDSRIAGDSMPTDADANGAYNIARKGLWFVNRIRESADSTGKITMSKKDWLNFVQNN